MLDINASDGPTLDEDVDLDFDRRDVRAVLDSELNELAQQADHYRFGLNYIVCLISIWRPNTLFNILILYI